MRSENSVYSVLLYTDLCFIEEIDKLPFFDKKNFEKLFPKQ